MLVARRANRAGPQFPSHAGDGLSASDAVSCSDVAHSRPPFPLCAKERQSIHRRATALPTGQSRLRDKLCLLIRKYELDPSLVKRYAGDFCGTETLRDAGRDLVETFVLTVAEEAAKDRAALICKLNSYYQPEEVRS